MISVVDPPKLFALVPLAYRTVKLILAKVFELHSSQRQIIDDNLDHLTIYHRQDEVGMYIIEAELVD